MEKKYAELGLSKEKTDLLHEYFFCFSNLYGVIMIRDAWQVFRNYEGVGLLHKKDFEAFSDIAKREPRHPYTILELKEAYSGETTDDPAKLLIVNNRLIRPGYGKYTLLYYTVDLQGGKPYYMPAEKLEFLSYAENRFYLSSEEKTWPAFWAG